VIRQRLPLTVHTRCSSSASSWRGSGDCSRQDHRGRLDQSGGERGMKSIVRKGSGNSGTPTCSGWREKRASRTRRWKTRGGSIGGGGARRSRTRTGSRRAIPTSRIARMKDGTTRLAHKAEHAVDVASDLLVAAVIHPADRSDHETVAETVAEAQVNAEAAGVQEPAREVVRTRISLAETVAGFTAAGVRTYIRSRSPAVGIGGGRASPPRRSGRC